MNPDELEFRIKNLEERGFKVVARGSIAPKFYPNTTIERTYYAKMRREGNERTSTILNQNAEQTNRLSNGDV